MTEMKIAVIGIGYVGLEIAVALSKYFWVYGYDIDQQRIDDLKNNIDKNLQFTSKELKQSRLVLTSLIENIKDANIYIITVPTPTIFDDYPDLELLQKASQSIGSILKKNDIVIYESSVYPGTTNEICIPILENYSNLKESKDFFVGYSPERICPSDPKHPLKSITKLISANHPKTLTIMKKIYKKIALDVFEVSKIEHAEAAKILENTQRDVNIALMNEYSKIMHAMNLNMHEIIEAAVTKFNFIPFKPGLVGGHCIAIDPLYIAFQAKQKGIQPDLILKARKINDAMSQYILQEMVKILITGSKHSSPFKVGVFGVTYKANIPDIRNSLVFKFIQEAKKYPVDFQIHDPYFSKDIIYEHQLYHLSNFNEINNLDLIIIFTDHNFYKEKGMDEFIKKCKAPHMMMDIPNLFINDNHQNKLTVYWNL